MPESGSPPGLSPDARFSRCDVLIDQWEGGPAFTNNPKDPGGATRHGITLATLSAWRGHGCTVADVEALTAEEASAIRRALYWAKVQGDQLPAGLDLIVYDTAINMGPGTAGRLLQDALGLTADGIIGAVTLLGVHAHPDPSGLIDAIRSRRASLYRAKAGFPMFGRGWLRRLESCAQTAKAWAAKA